MRKLTIISDLVIDDLIALWLLDRLSPKTKKTIVSTFGNIPENQAYKNAAEFIALTADNWNLIHGSSVTINNKIEHKWLSDFNGEDGLWGIHPAEASLSSIDNREPNNIDNIISLGSLTDAYKTLIKHKNSLRTITVMGGAFRERGNCTPCAECNVSYDSKAASQFFTKCEGIEVKVVPLDVTRQVFWTRELVEKIPETNKINKWIKKILQTWYRNYYPEKKLPFKIHDPLAVYLTFFPNEAKWRNSGVEVLIYKSKRGKTEFNVSNPECQIAIGLLEPTKIAKRIFDILFNHG